MLYMMSWNSLAHKNNCKHTLSDFMYVHVKATEYVTLLSLIILSTPSDV